MAEPAEPRFVWTPKRAAAREVEGPEGVAVIAAPARDDDGPLRLAAREVVCPSQLERGLDRLRPAGHRVDGRLVERQVGADLARIRFERLAREDAAVGICQGPACAAIASATDPRP